MIPLPSLDKCMALFLQPKVEKGAALLDEKMPDWVSKINPQQLDLSCDEMCICGQLFGQFNARTLAVKTPWDYGFDAPDHELEVHFASTYSDDERYTCSDIDDLVWKTLDNLWLDQIFWRQS